jgi:hypothetical protein
MYNLLSNVAKSAQNLVFTFVRSIFVQHDSKDFWAQFGRVVAQFEMRFKEAANMLLAEAQPRTAWPSPLSLSLYGGRSGPTKSSGVA